MELPHIVTPQNFGMFEVGKIPFGPGQSNIVFKVTDYKASRKAGILTTELNIEDIL